MDKIFNYIRSSIKIQFFLIWLAIFTFLFIQASWLGTEISICMALLMSLNMILIAIVTLYLFIPKLLIKEKKILYLLISIFMIIALTYMSVRTEMYILTHFEAPLVLEIKAPFAAGKFSFLYILVYTVCNITYFMKRIAEDARQKEELVSEKKALEIKVLKSQINSHFLFNALNNIYSMTYFKDEYTSGYVLKLSQMMRYVLEDCELELTPLNKEIEYIENFIDFQKLRFEDDKDITFTYNITNNCNVSIPPMIFQPLVENCFKHSPLDVEKDSYIHIHLDVDDKQMKFVAENSQPILKHRPQKNSGGIGVENVRRRLSLHYGDKYEFMRHDNSESFRVELIINF